MPAKKSSKKSKSKSTAYKFSVHVKKPKGSKLSSKIFSKFFQKILFQIYEENVLGWLCSKSKKKLGVKGFVAIKKGTPLYNRATKNSMKVVNKFEFIKIFIL